MAKYTITTIYEVTDYKTGKQELLYVSGFGEESARFARSQ